MCVCWFIWIDNQKIIVQMSAMIIVIVLIAYRGV